MEREIRRNFKFAKKLGAFVGLGAVAGFLIYKGEIYTDPQGSIVPLVLCMGLAMMLVLTGISVAIGERAG